MGLRFKILLNALVVFGTAAGIAGLTLWTMAQTRASATIITSELAPQMLAANQLMRQLWEAQLYSQSFSLSGQPAYLNKARERLDLLQTTLESNRQLPTRITSQAHELDLRHCQALLYRYRQLVDDTVLTYSRTQEKLVALTGVTASFRSDLERLRQRAFATSRTVVGNEQGEEATLALYGRINLAADHALVAALKIGRCLDPEKIKSAIAKLVEFEKTLGEIAAQAPSLREDAVLDRIAQDSSAMRNALVVALIQSLRLSTLQQSRSEAGEEFVQLIAAMSDRSHADLAARMSTGARLLLSMSATIFVGCCLLVGGALIWTAVLSRSLVNAIAEVSSVAEAMARGNLEVALRVDKLDEIGRMAQALNTTIRVLRTLISDLSQARDQAVSAEKAKAQFLANMSHEIRTPMNVILGLTGVVLETELTAEQREDLVMVHQSAEHLLVVLNDILDVSKLEAGQFRLSPRPMNIRTSIEDTVALFTTQALVKSLSLTCITDSDVPEAMITDPDRLRQILTNLLSNALKFTARGTIEVLVARDQAAEDMGTDTIHDLVHLRITVRDSGIGIDPLVLPHLFQPFVQADSSISRQFGGTGLGLTICKQLCELLGGAITVRSIVGVGSEFSFTLCGATVPVAPLPTPRLESA